MQGSVTFILVSLPGEHYCMCQTKTLKSFSQLQSVDIRFSNEVTDRCYMLT